jgi:hypothetical protein
MKKLALMAGLLLAFCSCGKEDVELPSLDFKPHILQGHNITSLAFDGLGNAWMGTWNWQPDTRQNLPLLIKYHIASGKTTVYDAANSPIQPGMIIWTIAADSKNNIWIGCDGLLLFDGQEFTKYDADNSPIPVNFVRSIAVDSKDRVWFSASSHLEGGLLRLEGPDMQLFTPDNSGLPAHGVANVAVDRNDRLWLAQYGYLNDVSLVKTDGDSWTRYGPDEMGCILPYWGSIALNSRNQVCGGIDYTLSSASYNPRPQVILFDGKESKLLQFDGFSSVLSLAVDRDDNIWCRSHDRLAVYHEGKWLVDSLTFRDVRMEALAVSRDNKLWVATEDGIFINE